MAQSLQESSRDSGIYIQHMSGAICGRRFLLNGLNHMAQRLRENCIRIRHMSNSVASGGHKFLQNGRNWTACRLLQVDFPVRRFLQNRRSHLGGESL